MAQSAVEKSSIEQVTVEDVQARIKQLAELPELDEAVKSKVQELYQQALQQLESGKTWSAQAERFLQMTNSAQQELQQTKIALDALPSRPAMFAADGDRVQDLVQLERTLSEKETEFSKKKSLLAELETEAKRRASRRLEIPKLMVDARQRLADVERQLQTAAGADELSQLTQARRMLALARRQAVEQEILSYEREPKAYETRTTLLPLRRDLIAAELALVEQEVTRWQQIVNRRRQQETETQLKRARREASQAHPALAKLVEQNATLAERRKEMAQLIAQTTLQLEQTNKKLATLEDQFTRTREKVDAVGLTNVMGLLLRKQRDALPDLRTHHHNVSSRQTIIREGQLELLELEDRRSELANLAQQVQAELQTMVSVDDEAVPGDLETALKEALQTEKDYLDALLADANSYFDRLVDLDTAERQLIKETEAYAKYADERILWIRSASTYGLAEIRHLGTALAWFANPAQWSQLVRSLLIDIRENPLYLAVAILGFGALAYGRRRLKDLIADISETAARASCCHMFPTVQVLLATLLLAATWPGLMAYLSWRLNAAADTTDFTKSIAAGLLYTASVYLVLELFHHLCRNHGLADAHFDWSTASLRTVRKYVRLATALILPFVFVAATVNSHTNERWADSLGRLGFVMVMVFGALLVKRALQPTGGILQGILGLRRNGWLSRLSFVWCPATWIVPLLLAVLALAGYYYTAQQLAGCMITTAYLVLGLTVVRSLLLRWVLVRRRHLAIEQARQRRAVARTETKPVTDSGVISLLPPASDPKLDLAAINAQTRHLIEYSLGVAGFIGAWLIWVNVLPALRIFDGIELWAGLEQAVTVADLGLAILVFTTALIAAKNIPGLLEITLLQRLPIDAGIRYTIGTVSRYLVTTVGLVFACHIVGLGWAKVQWLIAAISVGLGFGLQEIFANFVSGLIILFERPVRVGDVVTVDEVTGVISRIHMRATTITNWDRKEFIVPNKEFITGRILNWTLSDQVNRVIVNVGIAYGSDTTLATKLLMQVARDDARVLDDPEPRVTFESFGESSLDFVLRCYLPDMDSRLDVIHDLHMAIDREFRTAGIEIAFPQRDIHVRGLTGAVPLFADNAFADNAKRQADATGPNHAEMQEDAESRRVA